MSDGERWATFDCYGTLIDWNGGILTELMRLFGPDEAPALLAAYHDAERAIEHEQPSLSYRGVLTLGLERVAESRSLDLPDAERDALARSLPEWRPFPEVHGALERARSAGWRLVILSNTDRDFIDASVRRIGIDFDLAVVASEIASYKPAHGHWERFFAETGVGRERHVHVAASRFHDIAPANELGLRSIWINRLEEPAEPEPTRELPDLELLPQTLDELVAA